MSSAPSSTLALGGFDVITFFENKKPRLGSIDYKTQLKGLTYCFFTQENLDRFTKNPSDFLPAFGGHCALMCGLGGWLREGSAKSWRVVDGRLYFLGGPNAYWLWDKFPQLIARGHSLYDGRY